jgi:hypothetical protein
MMASKKKSYIFLFMSPSGNRTLDNSCVKIYITIKITNTPLWLPVSLSVAIYKFFSDIDKLKKTQVVLFVYQSKHECHDSHGYDLDTHFFSLSPSHILTLSTSVTHDDIS